MNTALGASANAKPSIASCIESACRVIAPSWPLDRQIAVNPYWGLIDQPFRQVAESLRRLVGGRFALSNSQYRQAWQTGEISASSLRRALAESGAACSHEEAIDALASEDPPRHGLALLSDTIDRRATPAYGPAWTDTITQQVSQYCASYFDDLQADWHRGGSSSLFGGWRSALLVDHALEPLMHAPEIRARAQGIPEDPETAILWALERLAVAPADIESFLQACLLRINGWASWCAYLAWEAGLTGGSDAHLRELLAIRVSWEALLDDARRDHGSAWSEWRNHWDRALRAPPTPEESCSLLWQRAHEISFQERLGKALIRHQSAPIRAKGHSRPAAQIVFCIDVRSERFRRALESVDPSIETKGFAGFFGLPIQYQPIGVADSRPQLPGLWAPVITATDSTGNSREDATLAARRARRLLAQYSRDPFLRSPTGAFSLVETFGLGFVGALLRRHLGAESPSPYRLGLSKAESKKLQHRLLLDPGTACTKQADLVASILGAMSLSRDFARLLVLVGHGSQSANNPQAAALDCGACGGQTGEVNARVLAGLLNDPAVRLALAERGFPLPQDTVAIAALHNTTTDEVELFDVGAVPPSHIPDLQHLRQTLLEAGHRTRAERARDLGLECHVSRPAALLRAMRRRARDWAETRPEWGLANNAAFIVAPRARTRGLDLQGRCFLHDYSWEQDAQGKVLELIMTAPMLVTHWINLQYFASTADPGRFGSGNKVLHNVVCGRIGVFEGNSGDLRIGLSHQSVHDGERRMHEPLRLSVFIDAPRAMIDTVLARHLVVRHLVEHSWLHLFRFAESGLERIEKSIWQSWDPGAFAAHA